MVQECYQGKKVVSGRMFYGNLIPQVDSQLVGRNYLSPLRLRCSGCLYDQIKILLVSLGKGSKYDQPMELWNLKLSALGEVERV